MGAAAHRTPARTTVLVGAAAALLPCVVGTVFLGRYGWDRDELYFVAASHHLAAGYVDFPPLIAVIGRAVTLVFGASLDALRATTMLVGLTSVVLVALCARELGGGVRAQAGAALAWATAPLMLGSGSIFHPTWLDLAAQALTLYLVLVAVTRPMPRLWPAVGVAAGVGMEAKYTIATLLVALLAGFGLTRQRRVLRTRGPWLAALIALVLLMPNLGWEAQHAWPSVSFASGQRAKTAADTPPAVYVAEGSAFLAACTGLAIIGAVWMWRRPDLRPFAWAAALVVVGFGIEQGRAYYPLPALTLAVAAGAVALERWRPPGRRRRQALIGGLVALQLLVIAVAAPLVVPVRSTAGMISSGVWQDSFYKDEIGWQELVAQTARAWRALPPTPRAHTAILAQNYGEAGALARYGPRLGLPPPLSGHLSWQYWRPTLLPQRLVVTVGYDDATLRDLCTSVRQLGVIDNVWHLDNEERGRTIALCHLSRPLQSLWRTSIASDDL